MSNPISLQLTPEQELRAKDAAELLKEIAMALTERMEDCRKVVVVLRINHILEFNPKMHYEPTPEFSVGVEYDSLNTHRSLTLQGAIDLISTDTEADKLRRKLEAQKYEVKQTEKLLRKANRNA